MKRIWQLLSDNRGLETVEYAIISGLIVAGSITLIGLIGTWVYNQFNTVYTALSA